MADEKKIDRRGVIKAGVAAASSVVVAGAIIGKSLNSEGKEHTWQIDPEKCVQCGRCADNCVLNPSAVKCVQHYSICGYCHLCFGYFNPDSLMLNTGAENQICPTGAIERVFLEDPYFEYNINYEKCVGCAKCVKPCEQFGNASFYLQILQDRCLNCNECSIATVCPSDAFRRVPIEKPYLVKGMESESLPEKPDKK